MYLVRILIFLLFSSTYLSAQNFWKVIHAEEIPSSAVIVNTTIPQKRQTLYLSYNRLKKYLQSAPQELNNKHGLILNIPMPEGKMEPFECFFSSVLEDPTQHDIYGTYTYKAKSVNHPTWSLRMDVSPWGFRASVHTEKGQFFVEPLTAKAGEYYTSYYIEDLAKEKPDLFKYICEVDQSIVDLRPHKDPTLDLRGEDWPLMTFRLAISCTGEWGGSSSLGGGTVDLAMAKMISAVNVIDEVYEREFGIRLLLVSGNKNLIFLNPKIDPFSDAKLGGALIGQNTAVINRHIGKNAYDIGHVFTATCTDVGGIAALSSVCSSGKGAGVTCWYTSNLNYVAVQISCHEMGHQFSAPHTFNNCNGNESGSTAFEPGGGSTIMSYSGLCGSQSFVRRADPVFHNNSLTKVYNHSRVSDNGSCGKPVPSGNTRPTATIPLEGGFTIPYLTPFELTGEGIDSEKDAMTYSWEQYTTGRSIDIGHPTKEDGYVPLFRSFPPSTSPTRIFPRLSLILNQRNNIPVSDLTELLPPYDFKFKFAFTVRDNNPNAGAVAWDYISFDATESAGPFRVLWPNERETLTAGTYQLIQWDVAKTDLPPVNCKEVNIYLFKDGDYDHPIPLVENTPNDGSEWIILPDTSIRAGRIKIKAAHSIFFDVSDRPIKVSKSTNPEVSLGIFPNSMVACAPESFDLTIRTTGAGSGQSIQFVDISGLPAEASYSFSKLDIEAGDSTTLHFDFTQVKEADLSEAIVSYVIDQKDTQALAPIPIRVVRNYYQDLALLSPVLEHKFAVGPVYSWKSDADASSYEIEIATSPAFDAKSIVFSASDLTKTTTRGPLLDVNTLYFWHVRGINECGVGPWTKTTAFSTLASACSNYKAKIDNQIISSGQTRTFTIPVPQQFTVSDINIENITLSSEYLNGINIQLVAPDDSTKVVVWKNACANSVYMNVGFDDDAPDVARCGTIGDGIVSRLRKGNLKPLTGVEAKGDWKLIISNKRGNRTGKLENWRMQICGDIAFQSPHVVHNDTFKIKPNLEVPIIADVLLVEDDNTGPSRLTYTIVRLPDYGILLLKGQTLKVGDHFTQQDIWDRKLQYANMKDHPMDGFDFVVKDHEGGWTGIHRFVLKMDESNPNVATKDLPISNEGYRVFPNPVHHSLWIIPEKNLQNIPIDITLSTLTGEEVFRDMHKEARNGLHLDFSKFRTGVYLLNIRSSLGNTTRKIVVQ